MSLGDGVERSWLAVGARLSLLVTGVLATVHIHPLLSENPVATLADQLHTRFNLHIVSLHDQNTTYHI